MQYDAAYHLGPTVEFSLGVITAADPDGITKAIPANAALTAILYRGAFVPGPGGDGAETKAKYGRCVSLAASAAPGTALAYRIHGEDYIGQPMCETLAVLAAGTAGVVGSKAFKRVTKIVPTVAASNAVTADVGWADRLGLPYKVGQFVGGSEGVIDTGTGGVMTESATGFIFDNAGTATIVSPVDGYCTGVTLELSAASTAGVTGIVATTLGGTEYNLSVPILAVGQSVSNQVDPDAWIAVTRGQNLVWTSDGLGTGGTGTLIANFSEGGVPFVSSPDLTDPATLASKDPRGIYVPYSAPDGVKEYKVRYIPSSNVNAAGNGGLQGIAHFNQ
jgi:hypothetical protein